MAISSNIHPQTHQSTKQIKLTSFVSDQKAELGFHPQTYLLTAQGYLLFKKKKKSQSLSHHTAQLEVKGTVLVS